MQADMVACDGQVTLLEARHLPVWGFPWQSNPYCRLKLGAQTVLSRRDDDTSRAGSHRAPVWNQEFQLLVESPSLQVPIPGRIPRWCTLCDAGHSQPSHACSISSCIDAACSLAAIQAMPTVRNCQGRPWLALLWKHPSQVITPGMLQCIIYGLPAWQRQASC